MEKKIEKKAPFSNVCNVRQRKKNRSGKISEKQHRGMSAIIQIQTIFLVIEFFFFFQREM
jgi:hypothetical protein